MTGILTSTLTRKALEVLEEEGVVKISERIITPWYLATPTPIYQNFNMNLQERKRRDHIKDSFTGLKDAIPSLQARQGDKCSRAQILKKVDF